MQNESVAVARGSESESFSDTNGSSCNGASSMTTLLAGSKAFASVVLVEAVGEVAIF